MGMPVVTNVFSFTHFGWCENLCVNIDVCRNFPNSSILPSSDSGGYVTFPQKYDIVGGRGWCKLFVGVQFYYFSF